MKAQIFLGEPETGKSRVANMIAEFVGTENALKIDCRKVRKVQPVLNRLMKKAPFKGHRTCRVRLLVFDDCSDCSTAFISSILSAAVFYTNSDIPSHFVFQFPGRDGIARELIAQNVIITTCKMPRFGGGLSSDYRADIVNFPLVPTV